MALDLTTFKFFTKKAPLAYFIHNQIAFFRRCRGLGRKVCFSEGVDRRGVPAAGAALGYGDGTASAWVGPRWEHSGYINLATLWGCLKLNDSGVHSLVPAAAVTLIYGAAPWGICTRTVQKLRVLRCCVYI